jgi:hypothetical protein
MKKLIPLISFLLLTLNSFSQSDTRTDSIVSLQVPVVRLVIKDLIEGDGNKQELAEITKELEFTKEKVVLKDEVIGSLNSKVLNLQDIVNTKDQQFEVQQELSGKLEKELKLEKTKSFLYKIGTGVGVVVAAILYLQK